METRERAQGTQGEDWALAGWPPRRLCEDKAERCPTPTRFQEDTPRSAGIRAAGAPARGARRRPAPPRRAWGYRRAEVEKTATGRKAVKQCRHRSWVLRAGHRCRGGPGGGAHSNAPAAGLLAAGRLSQARCWCLGSPSRTSSQFCRGQDGGSVVQAVRRSTGMRRHLRFPRNREIQRDRVQNILAKSR